jgi:hypothetical protein
MDGDAVPFEVRLTLRAGSVYYFTERALTSAEPHFFIVVNRAPLDSELLLLAVVTSQVEKVKRMRKLMPETVVDLEPVVFTELSKTSVVDCNQIFSKSLDEFCGLFARKEIRHHNDLPAILLAKIQAAIHSSPLVAQDYKDMISQ